MQGVRRLEQSGTIKGLGRRTQLGKIQLGKAKNFLIHSTFDGNCLLIAPIPLVI